MNKPLQVHVAGEVAGSLFRATERGKFWYTYTATCAPEQAVSLTMPVTRDPYPSEYQLHPVFDMNLPEGALGERLRKQFSKLLPHFDDLTLLGILGASQIGRLRFLAKEAAKVDVPPLNMQQLLLHDGLGGSKRWPKAGALLAFARNHCEIGAEQANRVMADVAEGVRQASIELERYRQEHAEFALIGALMQTAWKQGVELSVLIK